MMRSLFIAATIALNGCTGAGALRSSAPVAIAATDIDQIGPGAVTDLVLIPTSIPDACGVAWDTMQARQKSEWTKEAFAKACSSAGYVVRCANGFIELDADGKTCEAHGGSAEYLKWVDA